MDDEFLEPAEPEVPSAEPAPNEVLDEEPAFPGIIETPEELNPSAPVEPPVIIIGGDSLPNEEESIDIFPSGGDELPEEYQDSGPVVIVEQPPSRPLLTTSFSDYTVTEGLLLLLLLCLVAQSCIRILKGGFSWLR